MIVLHLIKTAIGATWAYRQIRELKLNGLDVKVVMPEGPMCKEYRDIGVDVYTLQTAFSIKKPWENVGIVINLRRIIDKVNPDIVHSHFVATTLIMRLALLGNCNIKKIFHVPGPLHLEHWLYRRIDLITSNKYDYWIASCEWTKKCYLLNGISESRVGLVYYGVDIKDHVSKLRSNTLRKDYNIPSDAFVIGNVSYFYKPKTYLGQKRGLKGHEDLIDAFNMISNIKPNSYLVFVGGPWGDSEKYMESVKKYATNKNIIFTGFRSDVQTIYPDFDLACHPSHSENVGGAVESMLCGVPTIATQVGGFPDLIEDNVTGWLVPPKSPAALSECILSVVNTGGLSNEVAIRGKEKARSLLDVRNNSKFLLKFYHKIVGVK